MLRWHRKEKVKEKGKDEEVGAKEEEKEKVSRDRDHGQVPLVPAEVEKVPAKEEKDSEKVVPQPLDPSLPIRGGRRTVLKERNAIKHRHAKNMQGQESAQEANHADIGTQRQSLSRERQEKEKAGLAVLRETEVAREEDEYDTALMSRVSLLRTG